MEKGTVILDTEAENLASHDVVILNSSQVTSIMVSRYTENVNQKWCIKIFSGEMKLVYPLSWDFCRNNDEVQQKDALLKLAAKLEEHLWGSNKLETKITSKNFGL